MSDVNLWLERILNSNTAEEIFAIVDEFRPLPWSDDERAKIAKIYNAKLYQLNTNLTIENSRELEKNTKSKRSSEISKQDAGNQRGESTSSIQELEEDEIGL